MSTHIDKLFKSKLAEHTAAPSPDAWARVQAGLSKKNNALIWLRWAAVLLIPVMIAGVLVLRRGPDKANQSTALESHGKTPKAAEKKPLVKEEKTELKHQSNPAIEIPSDKKATDGSPLPGRAISDEQATAVALIERNEIKEANNTTESAATKEAAPETLVIAPVALVAAAPEEKSLVLEYTLDTVEPVAPAEKGITLTMELKEKKGFQKVLDFARDAKNSEGPFTALRQAKQELFALNFKKDKHPK